MSNNQKAKSVKCPQCGKEHQFFVETPSKVWFYSETVELEIHPFSVEIHLKCWACGAEWNTSTRIQE